MSLEENFNENNSFDDIRLLVKNCKENENYKSAIFWCEKLCTLTSYKLYDLYLLAHCYYLDHQYKRCIHLIFEKYPSFLDIIQSSSSESILNKDDELTNNNITKIIIII